MGNLENVGGKVISKIWWFVIIGVALTAVLVVREFTDITTARNEQIAKYMEIQSERTINAYQSQSTPKKTYKQARQALLDNDLEGVLDTIHPTVRERYRDTLEEDYRKNNLPELAENVNPLTEKVEEEENTVIYKTQLISISSGSNIFHNSQKHVEFTKTKNNAWKISSI